MRKIIYAMMVSLDGYIAGSNGELEWSFPDEELHRHFNAWEGEIDTHLYGRRMYEGMTSYWPTADLNPSAPDYELEYARMWKRTPQVVFSKTLERVEGNAQLVRGNIADEVRKLKAQPGKDMDVGGADIASTFTRLGLIDEYRLYVHPVVLGGGKPYFSAPPDKLNLQLVETRTFGSGVVLLRYRRENGG